MNTGILASDAFFSFESFKHFTPEGHEVVVVVKVINNYSELFIDKVLVSKFDKKNLVIYDLTSLYQIEIMSELLSIFKLKIENIDGKLVVLTINTTFFTNDKTTIEKTFYMNFSEIVEKNISVEGLKENKIEINLDRSYSNSEVVKLEDK